MSARRSRGARIPGVDLGRNLEALCLKHKNSKGRTKQGQGPFPRTMLRHSSVVGTSIMKEGEEGTFAPAVVARCTSFDVQHVAGSSPVACFC